MCVVSYYCNNSNNNLHIASKINYFWQYVKKTRKNPSKYLKNKW